jgi:hypothetical protein
MTGVALAPDASPVWAATVPSRSPAPVLPRKHELAKSGGMEKVGSATREQADSRSVEPA